MHVSVFFTFLSWLQNTSTANRYNFQHICLEMMTTIILIDILARKIEISLVLYCKLMHFKESIFVCIAIS